MFALRLAPSRAGAEHRRTLTARLRPMLLRALLCLCLATISLGACGDREAAQRNAAERARQKMEQAAEEGLRRVREVQAAGQVEIAHAYALDIVQHYPQTAAAQQLRGELPALEAAATQSREVRRLAELWTYHAVDDKEAGGMVYTAYIHASSANTAAPKLRLVLRRHPQWGQSVYLLMDGGDFACTKPACDAQWAADGGAPAKIVVSRAEGANPPALFIEDDAKALATVDAASRIELDIPLAGGKSERYLFEVAGLDITRLGPALKK